MSKKVSHVDLNTKLILWLNYEYFLVHTCTYIFPVETHLNE